MTIINIGAVVTGDDVTIGGGVVGYQVVSHRGRRFDEPNDLRTLHTGQSGSTTYHVVLRPPFVLRPPAGGQFSYNFQADADAAAVEEFQWTMAQLPAGTTADLYAVIGDAGEDWLTFVPDEAGRRLVSTWPQQQQ